MTLKLGHKLRIGLLGASKIAPTAVVHPAQAVPRVKVTGVAARDPMRAQAFADEYGIETCHDSYAALVAAKDVDLVYCALPVSHHAHWTIKALEAGKHVLCEKPFAMNVAEATRMQDAARANQRRVIEAFHYRHHPAFQHCMDWVNSGLIGAVTGVQAQFNVSIPIDGVEIRSIAGLGGGAMMDLGCYPLHWVQTLMGGPPVSVTASGVLTATGVDEKIEARLEFADGVVAEVATDMGPGTGLQARLSIQGELGNIEFVNPLAPQHGASLQATVDGQTHAAAISSLSTYAYQLSDVADALFDGSALSNEDERILQQQRLLDSVYAAAGFAYLRESTYP